MWGKGDKRSGGLRARLVRTFVLTLLGFALLLSVLFSVGLALNLRAQLHVATQTALLLARSRVQNDLSLLEGALEQRQRRWEATLRLLMERPQKAPLGRLRRALDAHQLLLIDAQGRLREALPEIRPALQDMAWLREERFLRLLAQSRQQPLTGFLKVPPEGVRAMGRLGTWVPAAAEKGMVALFGLAQVHPPPEERFLLLLDWLPLARGTLLEFRRLGAAEVVLFSGEDTWLLPAFPTALRRWSTTVPLLLREVVLEGGRPWLGITELDGEALVAAAFPLRDPWGKVVGMAFVGSRQHLFQPLLTLLRSSALMLDERTRYLFAVAVLLAILLALPIAHGVALLWVRPLKLLHEQALRLGAGDFEARVELRTGDELETLAEVLNQAAARLQEARRAERMAIIGQTASALVHDLKNPLTVIRGFAPLLKDPSLSPAEREEFSGVILEASDRILHMVQDLLDFAKGEEHLNLQEVNLASFLQTLGRKLEREMETAHVQVQVRVEEPLQVRLDPRKMERVIYNLAGNARDAMPAGGLFEIRAFREDNEVVLHFRDTGGGIPAEIQERIFEAFFTHGKEHGTGLGLAICRRIVEAHGGRMCLLETSTAGTTFEIRLPKEG